MRSGGGGARSVATATGHAGRGWAAWEIAPHPDNGNDRAIGE